MARPSDGELTPADIDFYYHQQVIDVWQAVHACVSTSSEEDRFESVCGLTSGRVHDLDDASVCTSVSTALNCDCNPCALCRESGAFDDHDSGNGE